MKILLLKISSLLYTIVLLLLLFNNIQAQKGGSFRPYNPIQNIFDTIFRGPPGSNPANGHGHHTTRNRLPLQGKNTSPQASNDNLKLNSKPDPKKSAQLNSANLLLAKGGTPQKKINLPPPPPPHPTIRQRQTIKGNTRPNRPSHVGNRNGPGNPRIILRSHQTSIPKTQQIIPPLVLKQASKEGFSNPSQPTPLPIQNLHNKEKLLGGIEILDPPRYSSQNIDTDKPLSIIIDDLKKDVPSLNNKANILVKTVTQNVVAQSNVDQVNPFGGEPILDNLNLLETLNFKLVPRGNSGPIFNNNHIHDNPNKDDITKELTESDGFYFAKSNAKQQPLPFALSQKRPKQLDLSESINHNHIVNPDDISNNDRIDFISQKANQVKELVNCGGSDLGFCDMSHKYPGHMMGSIMSECTDTIYKGFIPVPDDLEELEDGNPIVKYSNSSKSSVRAQQGSWSWKPYTYKKKQICNSETKFIKPGYARDTTGKWQVIVQTKEILQRVAIDLCHSPGESCYLMSDCGRKSRCIQRYSFQHLLALDPENLHSCPTLRAFKFPSSCMCHIELANHY